MASGSNARCTDSVERLSPSRRCFLRAGSAAVGGLSFGLLDRTANGETRAPRANRAAIVFFLAGGPSQLDMYDMKPDMPDEVRGPFQPIETNLPGFSVSDLMPHHTRIARHLAVVRSLTHNLSVHDDATHWVQTGFPLLNARQRGQQQPSQGSVVACVRGPNRDHLPAYVCVPEDYRRHMGFYETAAYLSSRFNAVNAGGDPSLGNYRPPDFQLPAEISLDRLAARRQLTTALDRFQRQADAITGYRAMDDATREALQLVTSPAARDAFDLSRESDATKEKYGRNAYGQGALLARRLVESGVTYVTINLYEKDVDWWDDHYTIEANLRKRLPRYDQALAALIEDLHERGLSNQVLVAAFGEFGRSPRIDKQAGRGHWPSAMTAILSGGGLCCGQIVGATTRDAAEPKERPLGPGDLLATIYHSLGIDYRQTLPDLQGRPIPIVPEGQPIRELTA